MSDQEPIRLVPSSTSGRPAGSPGAMPAQPPQPQSPPNVSFDSRELREILGLYGRMVAAGEWRDYAIDFLKEQAVFSVFRHASEAPLYRIEKTPKLARRQGAYAVVATGGMILKRGQDLPRVLDVLDRKLKIVAN